MNKAFLTVGIILMAILGFYSISVISGQQTGAELDYYLLKETTEASMNDAIDPAYFRQTGLIRMDKEKFAESFVKRFATNVEGTRDYDIKIYDLNETPPRVSIRVISPKKTAVVRGLNGNGQNTVDITTSADMLVETKNKSNIAATNKSRKFIRDLNITSYNGLSNNAKAKK